MPPASQSKEVNTENIQEKNIDLADHSEMAVFELQEIHDALDHVLDYLVRQNDETIQEIHRQTHIDKRIISEVTSYDGHIETKENTIIQDIFSESVTESIPEYEIIRESISEIIRDDDMTTSGGTTYEHHKFTEKLTLNTSPSVDEKENNTVSHTTNTERKKMLIVIILLSLAVIVLGIVIIRH